MRMERDLIVIAGVAFCALAPLTRAQCPQMCYDQENTAVGDTALANTTGGYNTGVGWGVLFFNIDGHDNTGVGDQVMNNGTGSYNTGVGSWAMVGLNETATGSYNTATGYAALELYTSGISNTAAGAYALQNDSSGSSNTAIGHAALLANSTASNNTAVGDTSLENNTTGGSNTASGAAALFSNTSGGSNTATGFNALDKNTTGSFNVASGRGALFSNTTASNNTATGYQALNLNTTGTNNSATGMQPLFKNKTGSNNTATGTFALQSNTGNNNTADGENALEHNTTGLNNTAVGNGALVNNTSGGSNIALGASAGLFVTTGSSNIDIGSSAAAESNTTRIGTSQTNVYIAGISGVTVASGVGVIVDSSGHLGTVISSARYKDNIRPMDRASESILALQPVTFRYKKEFDPKAIQQFGLVAEQVEKVDPDLVARDEQGKPYSVRYEAVNAMLLNEFLKEHRKVEALEATVARQEKTFEAKIAALTAALNAQATQIQRVSDQLAAHAVAPTVVANN